MKHLRRSPSRVDRGIILAAAAAACLAGGFACRKGGSEQKPGPRADVPAVDTAPATPPAKPDAGAPATADGAAPDAPPATESSWILGGLYSFRLGGIDRCDDSATSSGATRKGLSWVGVQVHVLANANEMFVSPRDLTLERGGVILQAKSVNPPSLPGCLPLLAPAQLRAAQSAKGFVLFEVPSGFRAASNPIVLAYHPTRWGGAKRTEVKIPACFDACPKAEPAIKADAPTVKEKQRGRDALRRKRP